MEDARSFNSESTSPFLIFDNGEYMRYEYAIAVEGVGHDNMLGIFYSDETSVKGLLWPWCAALF